MNPGISVIRICLHLSLATIAYVSTGMGDHFSALLYYLIALELAIVD